MFLFIRYKLDQMFWTGGDTFTTGFTCFFVDYCNSVYDMDRIKRTCLYAASETKTSERTSFWSAILHHGCHLAVCNSCIIICLFCFFAGSCTFYKGNLLCAFFCSNTHDFTDFRCSSCTARQTGIHRSTFVHDGIRIVRTAGIAACTTVCTWQGFGDFLCSFIDFDGKDL